jgi:hypothetical protein
MEEKLIAPCGMNCGLCVNDQAGKYDLKKRGLTECTARAAYRAANIACWGSDLL